VNGSSIISISSSLHYKKCALFISKRKCHAYSAHCGMPTAIEIIYVNFMQPKCRSFQRLLKEMLNVIDIGNVIDKLVQKYPSKVQIHCRVRQIIG